MDPGHWTTDPVSVIAVLLFIGAVVNALLSSIEARFGFDPTNPSGRYPLFVLQESTPLKTPVRVVAEETSVYATAGAQAVTVGRQRRGAWGTLADGPLVLQDAQWWKVDFFAGADGWVPARVLRGGDARALLTDPVPPGTRVAASFNDVAVYPSAGGGAARGTQSMRARGRVVEGPLMVGGARWWKVDFEKEPDGWVEERNLERIRPASFTYLTAATPLSSAVRTTVETPLYRDPGKGILDFLEQGVRGVLTGGPEEREGITWWRVAFRGGKAEGWLPAATLERVLFPRALSSLSSLKVWLFALSLAASALLAVFIFGVLVRLARVRREELAALWRGAPQQRGVEQDPRWRHIEMLMQSENPAQWRQAILEADIILDALLTKMGYQGLGVGEKLRQIERSDFSSIDAAWEAHRVRNRIAHEGSEFLLTKREAQRVLQLYRAVFEEFFYL